MANVKITELPLAATLDGTEALPVVQTSTTSQTTIQNVSNYVKPYKVYTALLTQSGGNQPDDIFGGNGSVLDYGQSFLIVSNPDNYDLTIFGAENNNAGTWFVCNDINSPILPYTNTLHLQVNYGAPVVTVLENTIGNIWFTFNNDGDYNINSNELFIQNKTGCFIAPTAFSADYVSGVYTHVNDTSSIKIFTNNYDTPTNGVVGNTLIEIRVYN